MRSSRLVVAVLVSLVLIAGCSHRMSRSELVAANSRPEAEHGGIGEVPSGSIERPGSEPTAGETVIEDRTEDGDAVDTSPVGERVEGSAPPVTGSRSASQCAARTDSSALLIGSVGNYSGPAGSSLLPTARTLQAWAEWTNQNGGICGHRVQVAVVDDHSDPAQYRAALQELVENRGAVAFINAASLTGAAGIEYLEGVKVPAIGGGCAVEAEFQSPIYFLTCAPPADQYYAAARNAVLFGPPSHKFGLVTCREVDVCGSQPREELIERDGARRSGADMVYEAQASITQPDYTAECRGAQAAGAESVSLMLDAASVRRFGQSCARQGYEPVFSQISATVTAATKDYPGLGNLLVATPTFAFTASETPAQQEFQHVMATLYDGDPGPAESLGWAAAKLFELAARRVAASSATITPAGLVGELQKLENETLDGLTIPLTFGPGRPGEYPPCWFTVRATGGQWSQLNEGKPICR